MFRSDEQNQCPSIYHGIVANPVAIEHFILIVYVLIFLIGLIGNIMTIIIIKSNIHLRTPTNFYLLNLAISDLMMLMCNLPIEMMEIYHRQWPLSIVFCKLRNVCAEFFTCSSILTILAFTCERYFAIVHPIHFHRLSHFRRAQTIIILIWLISLIFSLPHGLSYEIENNVSTVSLTKSNSFASSALIECKACVSKKSWAKLLSIIVIITSFTFFYFPMMIIGAIYLFIGRALRRLSQYEIYAQQVEPICSSQSSLSHRETIDMQRRSFHFSSYTWLKMRARCQARQVVVKTLIAVVIAFFICYAPLYLQRLLVALMTLTGPINIESSLMSNFMAYLYIISGLTFYFGSAINPILYNVVSNKYRRAFRNLCWCRWTRRKKTHRTMINTARLANPKQIYAIKSNFPIKHLCAPVIFDEHQQRRRLAKPLSLNLSLSHSKLIVH